jgi:Icc-related predicted phosphoesterase
MRILVVADLHYSLKQFDWVGSVAGEYDLVIVAGDLLDLAGHADLDTQIVVVLKYLDRIRSQAPLLVSSGNHDGDVKNDADEFVAQWLLGARKENLHVDGDSVSISGNLFTLCAWWDGPVTRDALNELIEDHGDKARNRWIWIHHAPPNETLVSWTGKGHYGDAHLKDSIGAHSPQFVFSGHVHNSPFRAKGSWVDKVGETWVFNPGRELGALPPYIVLNLAVMEAKWVSSMGTEHVDLEAPLPERAL